MASNPIGILFLIIGVAVLLIYGMGAVNTQTELADQEITRENSSMYNSYESAKKNTEQGFNVMSYAIWILFAVFVFAVLYMLVK